MTSRCTKQNSIKYFPEQTLDLYAGCSKPPHRITSPGSKSPHSVYSTNSRYGARSLLVRPSKAGKQAEALRNTEVSGRHLPPNALPKPCSKAGPVQTTAYMRILQSTRLQPNSLRQRALPAQLPPPSEMWTSASLYPVCAHTQEGLEGPKTVTMTAKYCESPGQSKGRYAGIDGITPSVHQGNITAQRRGSSAQRHLGITSTAITSFQEEKLLTLRR